MIQPRQVLPLAAALIAVCAFGQTRAPTPESGIGVWYQPGAPAIEQLWRDGDPGQRLMLRGRVLRTDGTPVGGARIEMWHADAEGVVHPDRYRATLSSKPDGRFRLSTVLPGYVWGPRHIHVIVDHAGHHGLITRVFFRRDPEVLSWAGPEPVIVLEDGPLKGEPVLFGDLELVLQAR